MKNINLTQPGIYNIYKPKGPTSRDVLNVIKKITNLKKIGHGGTLDPLADGVLVVAIGREYTKKIDEHVQKEKEYIATIKLGENSTTEDEEGEKEIIISQEPKNLTIEKIKEILKLFIGEIEQIPPIYSAVKIKGQEAYKIARKGEQPNMPTKIVDIKNIEILEYKWPILKLKVTTGKGVYIRSLARDLGTKLNTGAYLTELTRTKVGEYKLEDALHIDKNLN